MTKRTTSEHNCWLQGYAVALATVNRLYDQPSICKTVLLVAGKSADDFKQAGCEEYDLKELRKIMKQG